MAVITKEELIERIKTRIGEDTSDEAISLLEDVSDTITDYETRGYSESGEDWEAKYKELDETWRKKYIDRFSGGSDDTTVLNNEEKEEEKSYDEISIDDILKED